MLNTILPISIGAVVGALSRHYLSVFIYSMFVGAFPLGVLVCNVFGSFLMGAFVELSGKLFEVNEVTRLFMVTGFLGAFTTFSTFSLETVALLHRGQLGLALLYVLVSVCVSVIALYFGMFLFRGL